MDLAFKITKLEAACTDARILEEYMIGPCKVIITSDGLYNVIQPPISEAAENIIQNAMASVWESFKASPEGGEPGRIGDGQNLLASILNHIESNVQDRNDWDVWQRERGAISYYLGTELSGFMEVDVLMNDPDIEDIICINYSKEVCVIHRRHHGMVMLHTNIAFGTPERINAWVQRITSRYGNPPTYAAPIQNYSTERHHRLCVVGKDRISEEGASFAIRKFPEEPYVITHLLESKVITTEMAAYLWLLIDALPFLLIIGETGSGKTTMINALMCLSNPRSHIVVIEDTRELSMPHRWAEYSLTSPEGTGRHAITIMDLVRMSLRKKPHFVLIGEVRGEETREMFQGAATGHGAMTSFHAAGIGEAVARLTSEPLSINENQMMNLWGMIHISKIRNRHGRTVRRVMEYAEMAHGGGAPRPITLFRYDFGSDRIISPPFGEMVGMSKRISHAALRAGVAEQDLEADLEARKNLLLECMERGAHTVQEVFAITSRHYDPARRYSR